jgi:dipeptidyl aminopeptidase/acylaminoacyl peptidase
MTKRKLTIEDLNKLVSVTQPTLAPNQQEAVFVQTKINDKDNTYQANLWHVDLNSKELTQWTHGKGKISSPSYSLDGTQLAFYPQKGEKREKLLHMKKVLVVFYGLPVGKRFGF